MFPTTVELVRLPPCGATNRRHYNCGSLAGYFQDNWTFRVTVAAGMGAPDESVTLPVMRPVDCANTAAVNRRAVVLANSN
jgi:hypothetical protein